MNNLRDKFIEKGIPYDDIDVEMIELLDVLNFDLGLKTQFCCYGHTERYSKPYVVFDKSVEDKDIYKLIDQFNDENVCFSIVFNKWLRMAHVGESLLENWKLNFSVGFKDPNSKEKSDHLSEVVSFFRNCKPVK